MRKFLSGAFFLSTFSFIFFVFISLTSSVYAAKTVAPVDVITPSPSASSPTLVTATGVSSCQVDLSWDAVPGVDSYVLYYSDTPTGNPSLFSSKKLIETTGLSFSHIQIKPGTTLIYGVKTKTGGVESVDRTDSAKVTTGTFAKPTEPGGVVGQGDDNGQMVKMFWQKPAFTANGVTGYEIQRSEDNSMWTTIVSALPGPLDFFADGSLNSSKSYYHQIRSFQSDSGCSPAETQTSNWVKILTPTQPKNFSATYNFGVANPPIKLRWDASQGQSFYEISRKKDNAVLGAIRQSGTTYDETNPQDGSTYDFSVQACTNTSCSASTATSSILITRSPKDFIGRIIYIDNEKAQINLSFLDNLNLSNDPTYRLQLNSAPISASISAPTGRGSDKVLEIKESNKPLNNEYKYKIRADFGGGVFSDFSPEVSIKTDIKYRMQGAAWSGYGDDPTNPKGLGWLVMNSDNAFNTSDTRKWSVNIHTDGLLSGIAWAEAKDNSGYGWLSFNKGDLVGCPDDNQAVNCVAKMDIATGKIRGWARFISPGFEGTKYEWISLSNIKIDGSSRLGLLDKESGLEKLWRLVKSPDGNTFLEKISSRISALFNIAFAATGDVPYGLELKPTKDAKEIAGEIWNPGLGWIVFTNPKNGEIACDMQDFDGVERSLCLVTVETINTPPVISDVRIEPATLGELIDSDREGSMWCAEQPAYKITWHYFDADGDSQASSTIDLLDAGDGITKVDPTINRLGPIAKVTSTDPDYNARYRIIATEFKPLIDLGLNKSFFVRVQSEDSRRLLSAIIPGHPNSDSLATTTPASDYPLISVSHEPAQMKVNEPVKFSSNITRVSFPFSYDWTFASGTPKKSDKSTTTVVFSDVINDGKAYNLTIKKGDNQCSLWGGNVGGNSGDKPPRSLEEN